MEAMLPPNSGERRTLADLIFAKMDSAESPQASSNPAVIQKVQQGERILHTRSARHSVLKTIIRPQKYRPSPRNRPASRSSL